MVEGTELLDPSNSRYTGRNAIAAASGPAEWSCHTIASAGAECVLSAAGAGPFMRTRCAILAAKLRFGAAFSPIIAAARD